MTLHPAWALQQAIMARLNADPALSGLTAAGHVFDRVPPRAAYPYVAYGPVTVRDWSTGSGPGHEHIVTIAGFSREPGFREAYGLVGALTALLDQASLALTDHHLVLLRFDAADFRREADGLTSKGSATFRALTEQAG